jgi:hypothetical protein
MAEAAQETAAETVNELDQPRWSVISFERREGGGLTYAQAVQLMNELDSRKIPGLAIVADEAAERLDS